MAKTPSNMVPIGFSAPSFVLKDSVTKKLLSSDELFGEKCTIVMFICNHCPFVIHVNSEIVKIAKEFQSEDVKFIAISSNDVVNYPEDSPELMKLNADQNKFTFPYLYDQSQEIAKKYDAACTPDFYLYDNELKLVYRGQLDDSRPGNGIECDGKDLSYAIKCLIKNIENDKIQKPSIGCNIKWK